MKVLIVLYDQLRSIAQYYLHLTINFVMFTLKTTQYTAHIL